MEIPSETERQRDTEAMRTSEPTVRKTDNRGRGCQKIKRCTFGKDAEENPCMRVPVRTQRAPVRFFPPQQFPHGESIGHRDPPSQFRLKRLRDCGNTPRRGRDFPVLYAAFGRVKLLVKKSIESEKYEGFVCPRPPGATGGNSGFPVPNTLNRLFAANGVGSPGQRVDAGEWG